VTTVKIEDMAEGDLVRPVTRLRSYAVRSPRRPNQIFGTHNRRSLRGGAAAAAPKSPASEPLTSDDAAGHSRYAGTMSDSPGLIALRKSLGDSSAELPPENPEQMAHDAIRQILDAIESGVCPLGDWERRCLGAAITSLRGGHTHEARSRARQALWPEENRRNAAIAKFPVRPGMASVGELKHEFEAARAMPGRAGRRGAETV
jgi:hypothetical protein